MTLAVYATKDAAALALHRHNRDQWLHKERQRRRLEEQLGFQIATASFPQGRVATGLIPSDPGERPPQDCFLDPSRNIYVPLARARSSALADALSELSWEREVLPGVQGLPVSLEYLHAGEVVENYGRACGEIEIDGRLWLSFPEKFVPTLTIADEGQENIWERSRRSELLSAALAALDSSSTAQHDLGTWGTGNRAMTPTR